MKKMSINEAAEYFGVSKEAIHNRIRRGSLQSVVEDGVKFVFIDETQPQQAPRKRLTQQQDTQRYHKLLEEQNAKLQLRVDTLEAETRTLRDQKEQMLIEEREKIERIYKEKDEQLKNILTTLSAKLMLQAPIAEEEPLEVIPQEETIDAEIDPDIDEFFVEEEEIVSRVISLKKYLKKKKISKKKQEKIMKRFKKRAQEDERIIIVGSKYYIDTAKYEYSDLIK